MEQDMTGANKFFVIGLPRTGTTSVRVAAELMGLSVLKDPLGPDLVASLRANGSIPELRYRATHVFADVVISAYWPAIAARYPAARFILTVRNPSDWARSMRRRFATPIERFPALCSCAAAEVARWACSNGSPAFPENLYAEHVLETTAVLANRLLVLDVAAPRAWPALADFVGRRVPVDDGPFPHANEMRPTIPDVVDQFVAYRNKPGNRAWGSLHVVLDDGNVADGDVEFCIGWAEEHHDPDGAELARILLRMSRTQRRKLPVVVEERIRTA